MIWAAASAVLAALFATLLLVDAGAGRLGLGRIAIARNSTPIRFWSILCFEALAMLLFALVAFIAASLPPACGPDRPCTVTIKIVPQ